MRPTVTGKLQHYAGNAGRNWSGSGRQRRPILVGSRQHVDPAATGGRYQSEAIPDSGWGIR